MGIVLGWHSKAGAGHGNMTRISVLWTKASQSESRNEDMTCIWLSYGTIPLLPGIDHSLAAHISPYNRAVFKMLSLIKVRSVILPPHLAIWWTPMRQSPSDPIYVTQLLR